MDSNILLFLKALYFLWLLHELGLWCVFEWRQNSFFAYHLQLPSKRSIRVNTAFWIWGSHEDFIQNEGIIDSNKIFLFLWNNIKL